MSAIKRGLAPATVTFWHEFSVAKVFILEKSKFPDVS